MSAAPSEFQRWQRFFDAPADRRLEAEFRLEVLQAVLARGRMSMPLDDAIDAVARAYRISAGSIWEWLGWTQHLPDELWVTALLPELSPATLHLPRACVLDDDALGNRLIIGARLLRSFAAQGALGEAA